MGPWLRYDFKAPTNAIFLFDYKSYTEMEQSDSPETSLTLSSSSQSADIKSMLMHVYTMHDAQVRSLAGRLKKSQDKYLMLEKAHGRVCDRNEELKQENEQMKADIDHLKEKFDEPCTKCKILQKKLTDLEKKEATALYPLLLKKSREICKKIGDAENSEFADKLTEEMNTCVEDVFILDSETVGKPLGTSTQKPRKRRSPGEAPKLQLRASSKRTRYIEEPLPEKKRTKNSPKPPAKMNSSMHEILVGETLNTNVAPLRDDNIRVIPETMALDFDEFEDDENSDDETVIAIANRSANISPVFCKPNDQSAPSPNLFEESFHQQAEKSAIESPSPSVLRNVSVIKKDATPKRLSLKPKSPNKLKQTKLSVHAFRTNRRVELMRDQGNLVNRTLSLEEEEQLVMKKATAESLKTFAQEIDLSSEDETMAPSSLETLDAPLNGTVARDLNVILDGEDSQLNAKQENENCFVDPNYSCAKVERLKETEDVADERLITKTSSSPNYAHVTVVRKQNERRQLQAFSCSECKKYYELRGLDESDIQEKMKACRHRAKYIPPSTPEHYWSLDFPDTLPHANKDQQPQKSSFLRANRRRNKYDKLNE
ncbi:hypothetical protein CAPTEDRAFT_228270 [Capitella teleta]|uniref:DNA endonuclease activator Ctp1 C-terminal domain-containing protein n=1 Tax=Capitella teleta TaxID=283909 RepID=R7TEJ1_CAPTE|nr:hypothetical protein CAPTEDRAFT_228270 [Capitella teleta]|eukprot:ELT92183.1 hypothetical protein CAPTEDRAFT_228270 [Capitella teleta]